MNVMVRTSVLLACAMAMSSFAGCILELPVESTDTPSTITKKVVVTIEPDRFPEGKEPRIEDLLKTRFEYRHEGADVAADAVTVEFLDEHGAAASMPLSRFTTEGQVRKGDVITIPGANLTSGLLVRQGDAELAKRGAFEADWFKVQGMPIPFTSSRPGRVDYKVESEGRFDFDATNFDTGDGGRVHFAKGSVGGKVTGTSAIETFATASGPRIEMSTDLTPDVEALIEARLTEGGSTYDAGLRVYDDTGSFQSKAVLQFDAAQELRKVGFSSRQFFDMRVQVWDEEHARSSNYEPEEIDHPMLDETQPYEEEQIERDGSPEAWVVEFLERVWSTAVAVGDDYRLHIDLDAGEAGPRITFDLILQVAAAEERTVGTTSYPALRVSQVGNLVVDPQDGSPADFELLRSTYWVSTESYLPIYAQSTHSQSFDREKINTLFELMGEDAPSDLPDTASIVLSDKVTISMQGYSGDFTTAPLVGLMSANQGWMTGVMGAASALFFVSGIGSSTVEAAPAISWSAVEAEDRLIVTTASEGADWSRLAVEVTSCGVFPTGTAVIYGGNGQEWAVTPNTPATRTGAPLNEPGASGCGTPSSKMIYAASPGIQPGDYIELCAQPSGELQTVNDVRVMLKDMWSNTILHVQTFSNVARC